MDNLALTRGLDHGALVGLGGRAVPSFDLRQCHLAQAARPPHTFSIRACCRSAVVITPCPYAFLMLSYAFRTRRTDQRILFMRPVLRNQVDNRLNRTGPQCSTRRQPEASCDLNQCRRAGTTLPGQGNLFNHGGSTERTCYDRHTSYPMNGQVIKLRRNRTSRVFNMLARFGKGAIISRRIQ